MNDKERKRYIDQRNRDEYVRIMREKARRKKAAAGGGCLLDIIFAVLIIVLVALFVCGCYPDQGPYKPPEHDPWKWGMLIVVVMAAIAGGWWYSKRQAVR